MRSKGEAVGSHIWFAGLWWSRKHFELVSRAVSFTVVVLKHYRFPLVITQALTLLVTLILNGRERQPGASGLICQRSGMWDHIWTGLLIFSRILLLSECVWLSEGLLWNQELLSMDKEVRICPLSWKIDIH